MKELPYTSPEVQQAGFVVPDTDPLSLAYWVIAMSKKARDISDTRTSALAVTNTCAVQYGAVVLISALFYI